jgi:ligand-binding sensor domain-containing protein/two-component sensor histidine kinase
LFLAAIAFYSQTPSFNYQKLGSEEGLNNANIFNVEEHPNGLMYFTTQNGIYFYDGYNFSKIDTDSLKSNALQNAFIKNADELYLSIRNEGFAEFNFKTKRFAISPKLRVKENNADNFLTAGHYAYLLTSGIKVTIVDLENGRISEDQLKKTGNLAYCIYKTRNGRVLVGRSQGLYDATGGIQVQLPVLRNVQVHAITETRSGKLVIGTDAQIIIINNNEIEKVITPVYRNSNATFQFGGARSIDKIAADEFGRIWFISSPGENLYLYENNSVYDIFEILDIPPALINCMYKDKHENLWIGTNNEGVYYIQNSFFNTINFTYNNKNLNINEVHLRGNLLVAATNNGLYGLNITNNQSRILSKPDPVFLEPINAITPFGDVLYFSKRNPLNMSPVIFVDGNTTTKLKPVIARRYYPLNNRESIVADWDGNILLCNTDVSLTLDTLISFTDYRISVNALYRHDSLLYIGTNNGLFRYNFKTGQNQNLDRSELNFNINDIAVIEGKLYAAHEAGITDVYSGELIQKAGNSGLNSVKKIRQFNGQVWLATLDGLIICDMNFQPIKTLSKANGLLSNSVNDFSFNEQTVSIATARGVAITDFKNILRYNARLKPVTVSDIACNGEIIYPSAGNTFSLTADQEDIVIHFFSPLYNKPNKQFFRYRVDEGEWRLFENLTQLNLTTLHGGVHHIELSASADNITWSDNARITIDKEEKFSEKQSIYLVITLASLLLITAVSFFWISRVKMKARKRLGEEQQVNLLKHQAMNALLSPHFIFNSLTSIQNYINTNNSLRASEYLAKFSRLIRMIIEKAAQSNISIQDELARLTYYLELEKERFKQKFDYDIQIDDDLNIRETMIPNMIIQPYVENCIIHGILPKNEHGRLVISFSRLGNNGLKITIEDDGIGLLKAAEHAKTGHKSLGTSTIKNILEINSKLTGKKQFVKMTDKSTLDPAQHGTIIIIELEI